MLAIHQNGTSTMSRNTTMPAMVKARATGVIEFAVGAPAQGDLRRLASASPAARTTARRSGREPACSFSLSQQIPAHQRDTDDEGGHQEDRDRDAASPAQLVERDLVGIRREHLRGGAGPAAGHDIDDVEVVDG